MLATQAGEAAKVIEATAEAVPALPRPTTGVGSHQHLDRGARGGCGHRAQKLRPRLLVWRLVLTQDLNGEISRLRDDIRDRQFLLTSGTLVGNAMCIEKVCSG